MTMKVPKMTEATTCHLYCHCFMAVLHSSSNITDLSIGKFQAPKKEDDTLLRLRAAGCQFPAKRMRAVHQGIAPASSAGPIGYSDVRVRAAAASSSERSSRSAWCYARAVRHAAHPHSAPRQLAAESSGRTLLQFPVAGAGSGGPFRR